MGEPVRVQVRCAACNGEAGASGQQRVPVHSNVRAFRGEQFLLWQCPECESIHAAEQVELDRYYAGYPFHHLPTDGRLRALYANQLRRLRRAGLGPAHGVLDYGCGDGRFVQFLRENGQRAEGYDPYCAAFADESVLGRQYEFVVSQDCLEHVESPLALLERIDQLALPDGKIMIGTPDASAIDMARPEEFAHTLHAPYHRHILSRRALIAAGTRLGWQLERFYPTMYSNTRWPFLNERFYRFYLSVTDGTLDALVEPVRAAPLLARLPLTLFYGLFGSFLSRYTDVAGIFRKPAGASTALRGPPARS
jgi:2-polyprenyl-3-methyl-5-hydroxy-6-metoxy-1,4-benzoquinol methylase